MAVPRGITPKARACRREFLRHFRRGFRDPGFLDWERDYKVYAADSWQDVLNKDLLEEKLDNGDFEDIAREAIAIESRTNLLFSFEKMALRDGIRSPQGAKLFATGLYDFLHGGGSAQDRFEAWCDVISHLPRRQTRVLTWPVVTVFGMIADPSAHIFLKPLITRAAADAYGFAFFYASRPNWPTYASLLAFAAQIKRDLRDLKPRDMIDVQSFIFVLGSPLY